MIDPTLAHLIEEQFKQEFTRPFPASDVGKLRSVDPARLDQFHGELTLYFSSIAGYASSAVRLERRPRIELIDARQYLAVPFFEKHKSLIGYQTAITQDFTPFLFRELEIADRLRKQLLTVLDDILSHTQDR